MEDAQPLSMLPHFWLFWVLDGGWGSRVGNLSLLLHEWLIEAGVMTSLAISFLVRQSGRAGGISWAMVCPPSPPQSWTTLLFPRLPSAWKVLAQICLAQGPWAHCSSQSPSAFRAVPMGILPPEERKVCTEASKLLTAAFPTRDLALEANRGNVSLSKRIIARRRPG